VADDNDDITKIIGGLDQKKDPDPDPKKDPDPTKDPDPDDSDTEKAKQNVAFAKMRTELKEQKALYEAAALELAELKKTLPAKQPEGAPKEETELEKRIKTLEEEVRTTRQSQQQAVLFQQLTNLQTKYELSVDDLLVFADQAKERNLSLTDGRISIEDAYRLLNFDKITQKEVERAKAEIANKGRGPAPAIGPKGEIKKTGSTPIGDIIGTIADRFPKK
jgi:hypothetical protein